MNDRVEIVATGERFIGSGIRSFESMLEEMLQKASREIHIITYLITSSSFSLITLLEKAAERGVRVFLIANSSKTVDEKVQNHLRKLQKMFPDAFHFVYFKEMKGKDIHAKVVVVDRSRALLGSANLTWGGMVVNYELGIYVEGKVAWQLAELVERLFTVRR